MRVEFLGEFVHTRSISSLGLGHRGSKLGAQWHPLRLLSPVPWWSTTGPCKSEKIAPKGMSGTDLGARLLGEPSRRPARTGPLCLNLNANAYPRQRW